MSQSIDITESFAKKAGRMEILADLDLLAFKQYQDALPAKITKAVLRVVFQSLRDKAILDEAKKKGKNVSLYRISQGALSVLNQIVNKADTRSWNLAPKRILFYCGRIDGPDLGIAVANGSGGAVSEAGSHRSGCDQYCACQNRGLEAVCQFASLRQING